MTDVEKIVAAPEELDEAVTIGGDAYMSKDYLAAKVDRRWRRTWLQAVRGEDIAQVGDYLAFDICDDALPMVRCEEGDASGAIEKSWKVCPYRGRNLAKYMGTGAPHKLN